MATPSFSSLNPSVVVSVISSYHPPFATGTPTVGDGGAPATTTTGLLSPNPTVPAFSDDVSWISAYLTIHSMSTPSYRYPFILWIAVVFAFIIFGVLHWTGGRGGWIGAYWTKWTLRKRTWRKKHTLAIARRTGMPHRQPYAFPSGAQILTLSVLIAAVIILSTVGPDYIDPNKRVWDFSRNTTTSRAYHVFKRADFDPSVLRPFQAQFTIGKSWWTAAGRTGNISYALFPLCILFALKAPPFAIFALPFMIQIHFDKLVRLHRWTGRLIWLVTAVHVGMWVTQLNKDTRAGTGKKAIHYVWVYDKFLFGTTAFILLTLLNLFSLRPIRTHHYEAFYFMHILLVPLTMITAALHHPPVWYWIWAGLALWIGERIWRLTYYMYINSFSIHKTRPAMKVPTPGRPSLTPFSGVDKMGRPVTAQSYETEAWEMGSLRSPVDSERGLIEKTHHKRETIASNFSDRTAVHASHTRVPSTAAFLSTRMPYLPPPGFSHAVLLPGRTIRLHILTPGYLSWAPGQHFLIKIPAISNYTTHPFTVASVADDQAPTDAGRVLVLLIRAKSGWTKRLWDEVASLLAHGLVMPEVENLPPGHEAPAHGVLLRTMVDGAFGSSIRARWGAYSTVLIVAGGSGVSFAMSVLQYLCLCVAGRDGKYLGGRAGGWGHSGFRTERIRFVWLVREFSHVQWCASALRDCLDILPDESLEVNIFVTNFKPSPRQPVLSYNDVPTSDVMLPPTPQFAKESRRLLNMSNMSTDSVDSTDSLVELNYSTNASQDPHADADGELGHEEHVLDYTNFDGDDDTALPGESLLSQKLKKEGKMRRAKSRKILSAAAAKKDLDGRASASASVPGHNRATSTDRLINPGNSLLSPDARHSRFSSLYDDSTPGTPGSSQNKRDMRPTSMASSRATSFMEVTMDKVTAGKGRADQEKADSITPLKDAEVTLDMDPQEARDLKIVSEHARPGCGPASLNAIMRKSIAAQIDPTRVRSGDMRGSIAFVSEDFEY